VSRALSRKVAAFAMAATAGVFGATLLFAGPASAHDTEVVGVGECDVKTGTWNVKLTVSNDFPMSVALTNAVFTPALEGAKFPTYIEAAPANTKTYASTEFTVPGNTTSFSVSYRAVWQDQFVANKSATVTLKGTCVKPSASPSPSASRSVSPSASVPASASASTSASATPPPPALPVTGTPTGMLLGGGAVLVAGGAALVLVLRRRRRVAFVAE
jgi:LPXTG-motif cell wall-anchored protein